MNSQITIRHATTEDAEAIASVQVSAWRTAYVGMIPDRVLAEFTVAERTERWKRILSEHPRDMLVAEFNGDVIGWAGFGLSRDDDRSSETAEVYGLYIHPDHWRVGSGVALWRAACELLKGRDHRRLDVWVLEANMRARCFYESMGCALNPGVHKRFEDDGFSAPEVRYTASLD